MNKLRLYLVLMAMLLPLAGWCAVGDEFQSDVSNVPVWFTVTGENTVKVGRSAGSKDNKAIDANTAGAIVLPETVNYEGTVYNVTEIGDFAFFGCQNLTSVTIPNSVTSIGEQAFALCVGLTSVTIPNNLISIGNYAFIACNGLTSVTIPEGTTSIGDYVFSSCSGLTSVTIPNSVTSFGAGVFLACSVLKDVYSKIKSPFAVDATFFSQISSSACLHVPSGCKSKYAATDGWKDSFSQIVEEKEDEPVEFQSSVSNVLVWFTTTGKNTVKVGRLNGSSTTPAIDASTAGAIILPQTVKYNGIDYSITEIGAYAFYECRNLTSVTIPNGVTTIGEHAFDNCSNLTSITIPDGVTSIADYAFFYCTSLTSVNIPNSVTSIGNFAFTTCKLTSVTIPSRVTYIGKGAFNNMPSLYDVNSEIKNPFAIDATTFFSQNSDATLYVPSGCKSLYEATDGWKNAFRKIAEGGEEFQAVVSNVPIWFTITGENTVKVGRKVGSTTNLAIDTSTAGAIDLSETIEHGDKEYRITEIGAYAFYNCRSLTSVTIPSGVTFLGDYAFYYCRSLTSLKIPYGVTSIGKAAFYYCRSVTSIIIPNSVTSIGANSFAYCYASTSVAIPNSVLSIGNNAFRNCSRLSSVIIPNSVTSIGSGAFQGCSSLNDVTSEIKIPYTINSNAFGSLSSDVTLYVPSGCKTLYETTDGWKDAFPKIAEGGEEFQSDVSNVLVWFTVTGENTVKVGRKAGSAENLAIDASTSGSIDLPESIVHNGKVYKILEIGSFAFATCSSLTSVNIPNGVTSIGGFAFFNCSGLISVTIPNSVNFIGDRAFSGCSSLTSVNIPDGVTSIANYAFYACRNLTSVTIPNKVTSIGSLAFSNCVQLTSVTIPSNVTSIGSSAFFYCYGLKMVNSEIKNPFAIDASAFGSLSSDVTLYVPFGCKSLYETTGGWKDAFPKIAEGGEEFQSVVSNVPVWFTVIGENTVKVGRKAGSATNLAIDASTAGAIDLSETVVHDGKEYKITEIGAYAFYNCRNLTSVTIPNSVTSIANYAFYYCSSLTSMVIPNGVTALGNSCLYGLTISSLTLPSTLESIEGLAMGFNRNLTALVIPASVTSMASTALSECNNLSSLSVAEGNKTYDSREGICAVIETATNKLVIGTNKVTTIPSSVTAIGDYAFRATSGLNLTIPETVTAIGERAFLLSSNCNITIPKSVTSIGIYAFDRCSNSVITVLRDEPMDISENVFRDCGTRNVTLRVPAGTKETYKSATGWSVLGDNILEGNEGAEFTATVSGVKMKFTITSSNTVKVGSFLGTWDDRAVNRDDIKGKSIVIPKTVSYLGSDYTVTAIGTSSFNNCSDFSLTLPSTVTSIGDDAFFWCRNVVLTVPFGSPLAVSENVFGGASQNNFKLRVPVGKKSAYKEATGWSAFGDNILEGDEGTEFQANVGNLSMWFTVTGENTVKVGRLNGSYENIAIDASTAGTIDLPKTVVYDGKTYQITEIGSYAFYYCSGLTSITIPEGVKTLGNSCFYGLTITSLTLPSTLESIEGLAIGFNRNLTELVIPASVTSMASTALSQCNSLSSLSVAEGNKIYDSRGGICAVIETATDKLVIGTNKLTTIPSSVTAIGDYAFRATSRLNLTIPETVTAIGERAFLLSSNCTITIPKSVTNIGIYAFDRCSNSVITVPWADPLDVSENVFRDCGTRNVTLRVPAGSKAKYKSATGWSAFGDNILEGDEGSEFTATVSGLKMTFTVTGESTAKVGFLAGQWGKQAVTVEGGSEVDKIEIPNQVTYNGHDYTVTEIGDYSFRGVRVKSFSLPSTLKTIGTWAIVDNYSLTKLVIPASVTSIAPQAIVNCSNLSSLSVANGNETYDSRDGICAIVETETNKIVVGTNKVTTIPSSVTAIGDYAFSYCDYLNLTIPKSVKAIGNYAFAWCSNSALTVPWSEPLAIQENTFLDCGSNGVSLRVPTGSKEQYKSATGWNVFGDNILEEGDVGTEFTTTVSGVEMTFTVTGENTVKVGRLYGSAENLAIDANTAGAIVLPETIVHDSKTYKITEIGFYAFYNCSGITSVTIPKGVTSIEGWAFGSCSGLTSVNIPEGVTTISTSAFNRCSLTSIILPNSVTTIGDWALTYNRRLKELVIPASVTSLAPIFGCDSLSSLRVAEGNEVYDSRDGISAVIERATNKLVIGTNKVTTIPSSVTAIGDDAFRDCDNLNLTIPESVTSIGSAAFFLCSNSVINIPKSVTTIANSAFERCSNSVITVKWTNPSEIPNISEIAFYGVAENGSFLRVPAGTKDAYKNATGWSAFGDNILEGDEGDEFTATVSGLEMTFTVTGPNTAKVGFLASLNPAVNIDAASGKEIVIPSEITNPATNKTYTVTALSGGCFQVVQTMSLTLPSTLESIGEDAFADCDGLTLTIPESVKSIGEYAFALCRNSVITVQKAVPLAIDEKVFWYTGNNNVTLRVPAGSKEKYENATGWNAVTEIVEMKEVVTNDVTYEVKEDNTVEVKTAEVKTAEVNKTTGSVSIAQKVVVNNEAVTVTAIAPKAFQNVEAVKSVTIPATVESIGELAFAGCTNLKEVLCLNPTPVNLSVAAARGLLKDGNSGSTVSQFDGVDLKGCTLYVLDGSEQKYKDAAGWSSFGEIKPFAGMGDVNTDKAIDVSDVVGEVNQILGKASDGFLYGAGDMNADNSIDVSDVVSIVNVILGKTAAARSMERLSAVAEATASDHLSLMAGNEGGLSLVLDNTADYIAAQFDVRLSEGQTLEQVTKGQRARGHQLATAKMGEGVYRVLLYTIGDRTFSGQSGEVVSLGVAGEGDVSVENITFITAGESRKKFDNLSNQLTGIDAVLNDKGEMINDKTVWHDLQGRKLETAPTTKGVYLKNGKKVVVK